MTAFPRAEVLDSLGMFAATAALPEQVAAAVAPAQGLPGLPDHEYVEQVVVLGMGGSGIAGDLMVAVAGPFLPVPVVVVKSYDLPDFVGPGSLVFALSFSGDTEETVEAAGEAAGAGANVVVVTSGGELARLAQEWGSPVVPVPAAIPQPRAALGAMAVPPLIVLEEMGLFPGARRWAELAVDQLARRRDALVVPGNEAEVLARTIGRTIPLVHGAQ
ncbi:MAG: SIS domain-containing protein, partial [Acidimicrobiales bacterium]